MGTFLTSYLKSPSSTIRLGVNFSDALAANGYRQIDITGLSVSAPAAITVVSSSLSGSTARAYVGGGVSDVAYPVTFRLSLKSPAGPTAPDVSIDRTIILNVSQQ